MAFQGLAITDVNDPDLSRWHGYKKLYDVLSGHAKERWQCGYNVLQMFLEEYAGVKVPLYTLQLYLRKKARAYKEQEGAIANLTPEKNLKFGEFTQLEDMAAYCFGIKPFSDEFNDCMYYPALLTTSVGGSKTMTVGDLFANEAGKYLNNTPDCKDARSLHLACAIEESKYKTYPVDGREYTGGQIFAKDYEGTGYILKGPEFDKVRSAIAVEECSDFEIRIGGIQTSISQLFGYEYDKKIYEEDRRRYAVVFYNKLKNYFAHAGTNAGVPVVFNAMIYLIVGVSLEPEPSVYMLDPHDMQFQGDTFREKKKLVPMQYILGSPTGATLFFPPKSQEHKERLARELEDPALVKEARERLVHLVELALFNKESYLSEFVKKIVSAPTAEELEYFRILENFGESVFENAILDELCTIFKTNREDVKPVIEFVSPMSFSFDLLADELAHHFDEYPLEVHREKLGEIFGTRSVFLSLMEFLRTVESTGLLFKEEMLWYSCIQAGKFIDIKRIESGLGAASRNPLRQEDLEFYAYIFRGLLYLFNSQDRYSHVEVVDEFFGSDKDREVNYLIAAIGEGLTKGNPFRNMLWVGIVEDTFDILAEKLHKVLHGSVLLDMSIDRFLKKLQEGELRVNEDLLEEIAVAYNDTCEKLFLPLDAILVFVDKLQNRMKKTNIIKRQILVAISANIASHPDLKERVGQWIKTGKEDIPDSFHEARSLLLKHGAALHDAIVGPGATLDREDLYALAEGTLFKDPSKQDVQQKVISCIDALRLEAKTTLDGLHEIITTTIGNIGSIDRIYNVIQFNELFKLEGSRESEFAAKINVVYNERYEAINFEDVEENLSPLTVQFR